ncbi:MAG: hypothetical protein ACLQMU_03890 [Methanoregula sp.]|uniref:hypothetical protein n=1 Tax=Methanoregula sp. TaxID=2052170 RepID=UPI003C336CC3
MRSWRCRRGWRILAEAPDLLNRQYFDAIVQDYAMPDMDGSKPLFKTGRYKKTTLS